MIIHYKSYFICNNISILPKWLGKKNEQVRAYANTYMNDDL